MDLVGIFDNLDIMDEWEMVHIVVIGNMIDMLDKVKMLDALATVDDIRDDRY